MSQDRLVSAGRVPAGPRIHAARADAGVSVVGRLLWVGVVAGLLIGGLVAALLSGDADFFSIGAMVGVVAGVVVQALTAVALFAVRRASARPGLSAMRALFAPLPTAGALAIPWLLFGASFSAGGWLVAVGGGATAAGVAWLVAPGCLAPIARREHDVAHR